MRVGKDYFEENKSSFLSVEKDLSLIVAEILKNDKLCKLLYYSQRDCLKADNLNQVQKFSLINKQIKIVPKIDIDPECPNYIIIGMDNFSPNESNPEFRDCTINFDIFCHPDHWLLGDFALRPHKIAGEIDAMFNKTKLTGIGQTHFIGGNNLVLNDNLMGLNLMYRAIHGIEDEINPLK